MIYVTGIDEVGRIGAATVEDLTEAAFRRWLCVTLIQAGLVAEDPSEPTDGVGPYQTKEGVRLR